MQPPARLTSAQRRRFDEDGFLVIENALSDDDVATYRDLVDRIVGPTDAFAEVRNAISAEPGLLPLLTQPTVFPLVVDLMGPNIQVNTTHAMVTPPQPDESDGYKRITWHHDGAWAPGPDGFDTIQPVPVKGELPWLYTKVGFFLTDLLNEGMGGLRVVPGSHRRAAAPPTPDGAVDPPGAVELRVPAGDAVVFQQRLWHAVGPNLSATTRLAFYLGYCFRWVKPLDYLVPDPELLAIATPVERQLLGEYPSPMTFWLPQPDEVPVARTVSVTPGVDDGERTHHYQEWAHCLANPSSSNRSRPS